MGKYQEYQEQLFAEFLRLCDVIDQCARILTQQSPPAVIEGLGSLPAENTEAYVRSVSIDAAKKKDVVWETYTLMGELHGQSNDMPHAIEQARAVLFPAKDGVDDVLSKFEKVDRRLAGWEGDGATAVGDQLAELKTFVGNQSAYVTYLDGVLDQYRQLVETGEHNAEKLAQTITEALTKAKDERKTAKIDFALQMFDAVSGLAEAGKSKNPSRLSTTW